MGESRKFFVMSAPAKSSTKRSSGEHKSKSKPPVPRTDNSHLDPRQNRTPSTKPKILPRSIFRLRQNSRFIISFKFATSLPDVPVEPKLLELPDSEQRFVPYQPTTLETSYHYCLHAEPNMGLDFNFIDPSTYTIPETPPELDPLDEALLQPLVVKKEVEAPPQQPVYIPRVEPVSSEYGHRMRPTSAVFESAATMSYFDAPHPSPAEQLRAISDSFEAAKETPVHPTKPHLKPVSVYPVFPDFDHWANQYVQVAFDSDPCEDFGIGNSKDAARLGFLESKQGGPDAMVAFKRPDLSSVLGTKDLPNVDGVDEQRILKSRYEWARDYRTAVSPMDDTYLLYITGGCAYYTDIKTKITLSKKTTFAPPDVIKQQRMQRFTWELREPLESELLASQQRMQQLTDAPGEDAMDQDGEANEDQGSASESE
eukprot:c4737_g1_i1.p1 GENE.c4737_g1_i1~~c4737_g1_i1.p1  ORF type:complete len:426 (+),score=83.94 c4737_g1_i1:1-1278(+)